MIYESIVSVLKKQNQGLLLKNRMMLTRLLGLCVEKKLQPEREMNILHILLCRKNLENVDSKNINCNAQLRRQINKLNRPKTRV